MFALENLQCLFNREKFATHLNLNLWINRSFPLARHEWQKHMKDISPLQAIFRMAIFIICTKMPPCLFYLDFPHTCPKIHTADGRAGRPPAPRCLWCPVTLLCHSAAQDSPRCPEGPPPHLWWSQRWQTLWQQDAELHSDRRNSNEFRN